MARQHASSRLALNINMKIWCCAWVVAVWWCRAVEGECDVTVDGRSYTKDVLASGLRFPSGLAVDYSTNTMYLSFVNRKWRTAKVDLGTKSFTVIEGLKGPCRFTVNQALGSVYAGCRTRGDDHLGGLFQWNSKYHIFQLLGEAGHDVHSVQYYNDTLYYSTFDKEILKTFVDGNGIRVSEFPDPVWDFVIDARGDIILTNLGGLYRWQRDVAQVKRIKNFGEVVLDADPRGTAYACSGFKTRGVWRLPEHSTDATRLLEVDCQGLTFDAAGNIIYAEYDKVIRLLPC